MTTPRIRSLVSFAVTLTIAVALASCASTPSRPAWDGPVSTDERPVAVSFVNGARDYVHVYLIGDQRQWFLGRVEPGARATLRIPDEALADDAGSLRLAALEGQRITLQVGNDARVATTIKAPLAAILSQKWAFSETGANWQLTPVARDPLAP